MAQPSEVGDGRHLDGTAVNLSFYQASLYCKIGIVANIRNVVARNFLH